MLEDTLSDVAPDELASVRLYERSTAIHEAGHAVICRAVGIAVRYATILPEFAEGSAGHVAVEDPYETWEAWAERDRWRPRESIYRRRVLQLMAGREAEEVCLGECGGGDGRDQYEIGSLYLLLPEEGLLDQKMRRVTRRLVEKHRRAIERVADELLLKRSLIEEEIDALMAGEVE